MVNLIPFLKTERIEIILLLGLISIHTRCRTSEKILFMVQAFYTIITSKASLWRWLPNRTLYLHL